MANRLGTALVLVLSLRRDRRNAKANPRKPTSMLAQVDPLKSPALI
jgi:hypothetical protein